MTVQENLDGSRTEYFGVACTEARLLALLREVFEEHWPHVIFCLLYTSDAADE